MTFRGTPEASTELELALVFGAFIAVTTLFSYMALGASTAPLAGGIDASCPVSPVGSPSLAIVGDVVGIGTPHTTSSPLIDVLRLTVVPVAADRPLDIKQTTVTVMTRDRIAILSYTDTPLPGRGEWTNAGSHAPGEAFDILIGLPEPLVRDAEVSLVIRPEGAGPTILRHTIPVSSA
ncbi:hypothetical protein ABH15_10610 [Methanoculleus taiwanensis]|uniref:Flagellin n=1 Tax=Methanoculleus taiwanensis TaxID=1550565 RepID=A0A498H053_9EURY|nr:hypothetical protein [Methanoculleus taiwanensis]RXE55236.1 hypothetical protein ABH15_10610 [Methanoculleus taiwanensis]